MKIGRIVLKANIGDEVNIGRHKFERRNTNFRWKEWDLACGKSENPGKTTELFQTYVFIKSGRISKSTKVKMYGETVAMYATEALYLRRMDEERVRVFERKIITLIQGQKR